MNIIAEIRPYGFVSLHKSIGSNSLYVGFYMQQTIRIINNLQEEINILDKHIKAIIKYINPPILTISGIFYTISVIIIPDF